MRSVMCIGVLTVALGVTGWIVWLRKRNTPQTEVTQ